PEQRRNASMLYKALQEAEQMILKGERSTAAIEKHVAARIGSTRGAVLDYVAAVDSDSFEPIPHIEGDVIIALAVRFGQTRLIDNILVTSAALKSPPNHPLPARYTFRPSSAALPSDPYGNATNEALCAQTARTCTRRAER